jgi:hypothetical protein
VETLARANTAYLIAHPDTPLLAKSGVRYRRERLKGGEPERWQGIEEIIREGYGDCEDLAAWRVAELRLRGKNAKPFIVASKSVPGRWHIMVQVEINGKVFTNDPSRELGM